MKTILSLRKHPYIAKVGIFLIAIVLIAGVVGCDGGGGPYTLTMTVNPAAGGTTTPTGTNSYAASAKVNIQAVANPGYRFVNWSAPAGTFGSTTAATTTFTMPPRNVTVTAHFVRIYSLTMAATPVGGGTTTDLTGVSPYPAGTVVSIQAAAAVGYQFVSWTAPAGTFGNANAAQTTFTMPAQDVTVTAHFAFVAEPGPLDHFMCYYAEDVEGLPMEEDVYLEDQFGAVNATVEWAVLFGNPAEKLHDEVLTPISDPDHHLTFYTIDYEEGYQMWQVEVDNQFGNQTLTVQGPVALGVPTQKESHDPPVGLDHFLLYEVIEGPPVDVVVGLNDQFGDEPEVWVYEPILFANPVQKTHGGNVTEIENPDEHLVFYWIYGEYSEREVQVVNQFGEQTLEVYSPDFLAVPSDLIGPPSPVYHLTMAVAPAGVGTTTPTGTTARAAGAAVNIQAIAAAGYHFTHWSAPAGTFDNPNAASTTFTMPDQDVTVTANFAQLDHFKCYEAEGIPPIPIGEVVYLEDQFGAVNATVGWAELFCNPVEKVHGDVTTPISDPDHHFTFYTIDYEKEPQTWLVEVDNQFGTQQLTVTGPTYLAVPTQKEGHEPPVGLDHYLLYEVIEGLPVDDYVDLTDQFGYEEGIRVTVPLYFANPVQKTHGETVTEIENPEAHLVFYGIEGGTFATSVQVVNQFGEQTLDVSDPALLAVPSEKMGFTTWPPVATGLYAGSSDPGVVWEYYGGTYWQAISSELGFAVLSLVEYDGHLYAGVETADYIGRVYRYDGDTNWVLVGDNMDDQVASLSVYQGALYAGTAYSGMRLYRYNNSPGDWTLVVDYIPWSGTRALYVFSDYLLMGDWGYDRFGRWDGTNFHADYDGGGSCIYDYEEYGDYVYAAAWQGRLWRSPCGINWSLALDYYGITMWEIETFGDGLYMAYDDGELRASGIPDRGTLVYAAPDGIISMAADDDNLYFGTGGEAGYDSETTGIASVYKYDGISIVLISGKDRFGAGVQVLYISPS